MSEKKGRTGGSNSNSQLQDQPGDNEMMDTRRAHAAAGRGEWASQTVVGRGNTPEDRQVSESETDKIDAIMQLHSESNLLAVQQGSPPCSASSSLFITMPGDACM